MKTEAHMAPIRVELADEELVARAQELAAIIDEQDEIREELKDAKAAAKEALGELVPRYKELRRIMRTGEEDREIEVREELDADGDQVTIYAVATGEVVDTRPATMSDRQQLLDLSSPAYVGEQNAATALANWRATYMDCGPDCDPSATPAAKAVDTAKAEIADAAGSVADAANQAPNLAAPAFTATTALAVAAQALTMGGDQAELETHQAQALAAAEELAAAAEELADEGEPLKAAAAELARAAGMLATLEASAATREILIATSIAEAEAMGSNDETDTWLAQGLGQAREALAGTTAGLEAHLVTDDGQDLLGLAAEALEAGNTATQAVGDLAECSARTALEVAAATLKVAARDLAKLEGVELEGVDA